MYLLAFVIGVVVGIYGHYRATRIKIGLYIYGLKRAMARANDFNEEAKYKIERYEFEREEEEREERKTHRNKILADREKCNKSLDRIFGGGERE